MVIDTSALLAILQDEPERRLFNETIESAASRLLSVATSVAVGRSTRSAGGLLPFFVMEIHELVWPQDRVAHVATHGVSPEEVDAVCFGRSLVQRARATGKNPVYYVLGQTAAGRYLFCVIIRFPDGRGYPVTSRPMTQTERRRFIRWRDR